MSDELMQALKRVEQRLSLVEAFLDHEIRRRQDLAQAQARPFSHDILPQNPWHDFGNADPISYWPTAPASNGGVSIAEEP